MSTNHSGPVSKITIPTFQTVFSLNRKRPWSEQFLTIFQVTGPERFVDMLTYSYATKKSSEIEHLDADNGAI